MTATRNGLSWRAATITGLAAALWLVAAWLLWRSSVPGDLSLPDLDPRRYFTAEVPRKPLPILQKMIRVSRHDLTREDPPDPTYELIVCRNVVIYFDRAVQERLFQNFYDALVPGGVLLLGKVETLVGPVRERMNLAHVRERIYSKPPSA